jgi:hypothetical protein
LAIVQQGDVGALSLGKTYMDLLAALDEGTRALFGSSGFKEITPRESAGQFPDGFPFMRIFQEDQVPTETNSLSDLCKAMRTVPEEKLPQHQEAGDLLLDLVKEGCLELLPPDVRDGVDYSLHSVAKLVVSVRPDIASVEHYAAQVPHTSVTSEQANKLLVNGVYFFMATVPLTQDGCFLRL